MAGERARQQNGGGRALGERVAPALGWFSIGLGIAEVAVPGGVARLIGVDDHGRNRALLRTMGLREIASGVGILTRERPAGWVWSRVGGDVMDLALLGSALASETTQKGRLAAATAAVAGVTVVDVLCSADLSRGAAGVEVKQAITVNSSPEEVYRFWRDFENLPRFMTHLESVRITGDRRSHWVATAPMGTTVEWDAEIVEDEPNRRIAWRSLEGADVESSGSVRFEPARGRPGTEVHVEFQYTPPGGAAGAAVAWLFGEEPSQQVRDDLRRLKQVLETGQIARSDASIHSTPHPAQPAERQIQGGETR